MGAKKIGAVAAGGFLSLMVLGGIAGAIDGGESPTDRSSVVELSPSPSPTASTTPETVVEVRSETVTEPVPYSSSTVDDASIDQGSTATRVAGVAGVLTRTYEVTTTDGVETSRVEVGQQVTTPPVHEVIVRGTKPPAPRPAPVVAVPANCPNGTYTNTAGNTVCRPYASDSAPSGATAQCKDGTYSMSQSRSGTCSGHGGVSRWL